MFTLLQAARFCAAFLVVVHHGAGLFAQPEYFSFLVAGGLFQAGDIGVDFFFVLSGFIILHAHWQDLGHPDRVAAFLKKRVLRIYPPYLIVFCMVLPLAFLVPNQFATVAQSPFYILQNMLLLPVHGTLVSVAWSLRHEVMFYAVFAVMIWRVNLGLAAFTLWFLASSVIQGPLDPDGQALVNPHHLEFLAGMAAAWFVRTGAIPAPRLLLALGLGGLAMCLYLSGHVFYGRMATDGPNLLVPLALGSLLILVGLVEVERSRGVVAPPVLRYLGDASYSLYLVHFPVLTVYAKLVRGLHLQLHAPLGVLLALGIAGATAAGCLFYSLVERPLTRVLKRHAVPPAALRGASAA